MTEDRTFDTSNPWRTKRQPSIDPDHPAPSDRRGPNVGSEPPPTDHDTPRALPDGGTMWIDLTGFQRDVVRCIQRIDADVTTPTGRRVKEEVESMYGEDVNHGRLYQNLNVLVERGCIDKKVVDGRTNAYYLTDDATAMLNEAAREFVATCDIRRTATES